MNEEQHIVEKVVSKTNVNKTIVAKAPFKSVALAWFLTVLAGPVGLFYSSVIGGIIMVVIGLVAAGIIMHGGNIFTMATVWFISLIWAMISVRVYNRKILTMMIQD